MSQQFALVEPESLESSPSLIDLSSLGITGDQFVQLCHDNPELEMELTAEGELLVMTPTGTSSGKRNSRLTRRLDEWTEADGTGFCFDSSTMFTLPNGARRSPDASWLRKEEYLALSAEERDSFAQVTPDFVIELRSPTDGLRALKKKMHEYISVGVKLGWLIDPTERRVHVYRPKRKVVVMNNPNSVKGDPVLPGFELDLREIW